MEFLSIIWDEGSGGNVEHIADHGLTPEEVEEVLDDPVSKEFSRTSGDPLYKGYTFDNRLIAVVFQQVDEFTIRPITAYPL